MMKLPFIGVLAFLLVSPAGAQLAPPNKLGVAFGHVHLNVADIEVHKKLWVEHFDGVVVQKGPLTAIKLPGLFVNLTQKEPTGGSQGTVMDHFGFRVPDIDAAHAAWRAAGYEVQPEFKGAEGFRNSYLLGPDGVRIELQEDRTLTRKAVGHHIHFWTRQYRELMAWYVDVFAAVARPRGTLQTTADVPGLNMTFADCQKECGPTQGRAIDHIGFEVDDIEAWCGRLESRGVKLDTPCRDIPAIGLKIAYFTDPSGVRVELTEGLDKY